MTWTQRGSASIQNQQGKPPEMRARCLECHAHVQQKKASCSSIKFMIGERRGEPFFAQRTCYSVCKEQKRPCGSAALWWHQGNETISRFVISQPPCHRWTLAKGTWEDRAISTWDWLWEFFPANSRGRQRDRWGLEMTSEPRRGHWPLSARLSENKQALF